MNEQVNDLNEGLPYDMTHTPAARWTYLDLTDVSTDLLEEVLTGYELAVEVAEENISSLKEVIAARLADEDPAYARKIAARLASSRE